MSLWLVVQIMYASVAWFLAARTVLGVSRAVGVFEGGLPGTVRELETLGRTDALEKLGEALRMEPIERLLERDLATSLADEIAERVSDVVRDLIPVARPLRTLATAGTMLGLLSAAGTLRLGLADAHVGPIGQVAGRAFDCAVLGFVTALPCWTAIGITRAAVGRVRTGAEQVVLARASAMTPNAPKDQDVPDVEGKRVDVPPVRR